MKTLGYLLPFGLLFVIFSCKQKASESKNTLQNKATIVDKVSLEKKEWLAKRKQMENEQRIDSIRLGRILKEAINIAEQNIKLSKFSKSFEAMPDSAFIVKTDLIIGHLFSEKQRHLIIRRNGRGYIYINIFLINGNKLFPAMYHKEWEITYVKDTIQDVNGDGHKDFLVNWYGSSGCCLKNFYNVYLFHANKGTFTNGFEFINPTFSPKEKIIRGVEYGQPGDTELYKYKWNGWAIDTIEYIYPDKNNSGQFIKANRLPYKNIYTKEVKIKKVPKDYYNIYGYDWFTGKGY